MKGGIGLYLTGNVNPYRCPSDHVVSDLQRAAGWSARVRSHSMNAMLGYAGEYTLGGTNVNNPYYKQFFKSAQITKPSDIFVFIEEHPDSINDGYFLNRPNVPEWVDLPASYHRGGANLSFADGHMELRRGRCGTTRVPAFAEAAELPMTLPEEEREDFDWLMERMTVSRYYKTQK